MFKRVRIPANGAAACMLAVCLLPATCRAGIALNFTFSSTASSAMASAGLLTSLSESISTVTINGTSYSGLTDQLTVLSTPTADIFSISGALNGALAAVTGTWLVFETQPSVAMQNVAGDFLVTYGSGLSLDSVSTILASKLGVTFTTGIGGVSLGGGNGALINPQGMVISNVLSPTLSLTSNFSAVPEPSSCLLFGAGLVVIFIASKGALCEALCTRGQSLMTVPFRRIRNRRCIGGFVA